MQTERGSVQALVYGQIATKDSRTAFKKCFPLSVRIGLFGGQGAVRWEHLGP